MFSQACVKNSVQGGGVQPSLVGRHPPGQTPPWADTPGQTPLGRHPLAGTHPPGQTPPTTPPHPRWPLQRTVCILLECILVDGIFLPKFVQYFPSFHGLLQIRSNTSQLSATLGVVCQVKWLWLTHLSHQAQLFYYFFFLWKLSYYDNWEKYDAAKITCQGFLVT